MPDNDAAAPNQPAMTKTSISLPPSLRDAGKASPHSWPDIIAAGLDALGTHTCTWSCTTCHSALDTSAGQDELTRLRDTLEAARLFRERFREMLPGVLRAVDRSQLQGQCDVDAAEALARFAGVPWTSEEIFMAATAHAREDEPTPDGAAVTVASVPGGSTVTVDAPAATPGADEIDARVTMAQEASGLPFGF
jgi:peptidoglycan/xylan/chitin deacetylase (PgdA/CDA1 family)